MTDNRTTELCKLLEERGVEYKTFHRHYKGYASPDNDYTNWHVYGDGKHISGSFHENGGSVHFSMHAYGVTPEQAIAATLGSGTCRIEERNGDWYCDACGEMVGTCDPASELFIDGNAVKLWNYCPNCGARVEKVDA